MSVIGSRADISDAARWSEWPRPLFWLLFPALIIHGAWSAVEYICAYEAAGKYQSGYTGE